MINLLKNFYQLIRIIIFLPLYFIVPDKDENKEFRNLSDKR